LVEILRSTDGVKTKGGIIIGFNDDVNYAEGDNAWNADLQVVSGVVERMPAKLYYNTKDPHSMLWETDMELQVGDMVWGSIMEFSNAQEILCEGRLYKLIPYADIYVAKRQKGMGVLSFDKVIVLNGYVLCQTVNRTKLSDLDFISEGQIDTSKCAVSYVGRPNKSYKTKSYCDIIDIKKGDTILLQPRTSFQYLERKSYLSSFEDDELFIVVPRRKILAVLERENG